MRSMGAAGIAVLILMAGGFLAAVESGNLLVLEMTVTRPAAITKSPLPTTATFTPAFTQTASATPTITPTWTPSLTFTITQTPTATACPVPKGWQVYTVKEKDTLKILAKQRKTTVDAIIQGNCLVTNKLTAGMELYLPSASTATPTPVACVKPMGWIEYTVTADDTLTLLADVLGVTVIELQTANCMAEDAELKPGKIIFLPSDPESLPTRIPGAIPTVVPQPVTTQDG